MTFQRVGGSVSLQGTINDHEVRLQRLENKRAALSSVWAANFTLTPNSTLNGAQISFNLSNGTGIAAVAIVRGFSLDPAQAIVLTSYPANSLTAGQTNSYSDNDAALAGRTAFYWLVAVPANEASPSTSLGPLSLQAASGDLLPPNALLDFSASVSAGPDSASVSVGVSFEPPDESSFNAVRVYVTGYQGNSTPVAMAQFGSSPGGFNLQKTGETVILTAVTVNKNGVAAALGTGLTANVTLGAATAPCAVENVSATAIATGVQLNFAAGPESTITAYQIWRAVLGAGFGAATQIGTVDSTGAPSYVYLDTGGVAAQFEWYVIAVNPTGSSSAAAAANTLAIHSSSMVPPNVPQNSTNTATVDSIVSGGAATVRVYGVGGAGTIWTRSTGYGSETMAPGSISGLSFSTVYYILTDGTNYYAETSFADALDDGYIWCGKVTTCDAGGSGGLNGGGGNDGNNAGGRLSP